MRKKWMVALGKSRHASREQCVEKRMFDESACRRSRRLRFSALRTVMHRLFPTSDLCFFAVLSLHKQRKYLPMRSNQCHSFVKAHRKDLMLGGIYSVHGIAGSAMQFSAGGSPLHGHRCEYRQASSVICCSSFCTSSSVSALVNRI